METSKSRSGLSPGLQGGQSRQNGRGSFPWPGLSLLRVPLLPRKDGNGRVSRAAALKKKAITISFLAEVLFGAPQQSGLPLPIFTSEARWGEHSRNSNGTAWMRAVNKKVMLCSVLCKCQLQSCTVKGLISFPHCRKIQRCFHEKPSFLPRSLRSLVSFTLPRPFTSALFLLLPSTLPSATSLYLLQAKLGLLLSIYRAEHTFSFSEPKLQISWYNTLSTGTLFSGMSYHLQSIPKRLCNIWLWKLSTINICDVFFFPRTPV